MVQPLAASRMIPAEFLASNYYIFGQIKVMQSGLMGLMSDPHSSYLEINEANIAHIYKPEKIINFAPVLCMVKSQVVAVCLSKREYVGTHAMMRGGYTRLIPYAVQLTTPVYEMSGTLEWAGRFEFSALMSEGTNAFFMLYDASIRAPLFSALHVESPAVLVNRLFLDTLVQVKRGS